MAKKSPSELLYIHANQWSTCLTGGRSSALCLSWRLPPPALVSVQPWKRPANGTNSSLCSPCRTSTRPAIRGQWSSSINPFIIDSLLLPNSRVLSQDIPSDIIVQVGDDTFRLHKVRKIFLGLYSSTTIIYDL